MRAEVVVVGGGILGISTAAYLARRGTSVVVCERGELAQQASGRNLGFLVGLGRAPGIPLELCRRGRELYAGLSEDLGTDVGLQRCGSLIYAGPGDGDRRFLEAVHDDRRRHGVRAELLEGAALRALAPTLAEHVTLALHSPEEGRVDNQLVAQAYAREAQRHGARILRETEVVALETAAGAVTGVRTRGGARIEADVVIVAAGLGSDLLCRTAGARAPLRAVRGQALTTERLPPLLGPLVYNAGCLVFDPYFRAMAEAAGARTDLDYLCAGQTRDGRIIMGCPLDFGVDAEAPTLDGLLRMVEPLAEAIPALRGAAIDRVWAGMLSAAADGLPLVGWSPDCERLLLATGLSYGNTAGPAIGELVAGIVHGDAPAGLAAALDPGRATLATAA